MACGLDPVWRLPRRVTAKGDLTPYLPPLSANAAGVAEMFENCLLSVDVPPHEMPPVQHLPWLLAPALMPPPCFCLRPVIVPLCDEVPT